MPRIRRSRWFFVRYEDVSVPIPDRKYEAPLPRPIPVPRCFSAVAGEERRISVDDLAVLERVPADEWSDLESLAERLEVDIGRLTDLADQGLLITDLDCHAELRHREKMLRDGGWAPWATVFHFSGRWQGHRVLQRSPTDLDDLLALIEAQDRAHADQASTLPDPAFPPMRSGLPLATPPAPCDAGDRLSALRGILADRATIREFDMQEAMSSAQLSQILFEVWGCRGTVGKGVGARLKKTSPSAGALHPTEVYPLLLRVADFPSGLYHYQAMNHSLRPVRSLTQEEARSMADRFTSGQFYPQYAQALFIMSCRFRRCFWKYRNHAKAYRAVVLDVGHLSQSFYLLCTAMGLGPFFTSAINEGDIETELGLDVTREGALGICGCGAPAAKLRFTLKPQATRSSGSG